MKRQLKKLLVILLIILTLNNFLMTSSFAQDPSDVDSTSAWIEALTKLAGSVIGLLTFPVRAIALGAAWGINILTASVAYIEGTTEETSPSSLGSTNISIITPFDIFFNKVKILDVNFFDIGDDNSLVTQIRTSIAIWFYVLRNIAAAILLVILIYVGIRMAISTVATDKAMYKKMLFDWVASLALIFIIQYIIIFAITVDESIIKSIEFGVNSEEISNTFGVINTLAFDITNLNSIAATVIFCMLVWQTLGLVISYFNRMLKLAFLIIISPLITLTYSIDKMGDGKAQALGAWLKEFVYTILIQPFHCIIYMCFVNVAFNLLINNAQGEADNNTLGVAVVSILCVHFVKEAEKLIRKIFAFKDDNSSTSMTAGLAMAGVALSQSKNIGKSARGMINGVRGTAGALSASITGAKIGLMARSMRSADRASGENKDKTIDEYKEDARAELNTQKAMKIEKKMGKKYTFNANSNAIKNEIKAIKASNPGITDKEAQSIARLNVAKRARSKTGIRKPITAARGAINKVKTAVDSSEVLKGISSLTKGSISAGMGLMVGSGIYGTNGNIATAIAGGAAMFSGTQAFQKTAETFEKDISENFKALGVTSKEEGAMVAGEVMNNSEIYENGDQATQKMLELMENLGTALEKAGIDSSNKNKIKNIIERGIKANPSATPQIIQNTLNSLRDNNGESVSGKISQINNGHVVNAAQELADYFNKREIYNKVKSAADFNITADQVLGGAISRLPDKDIDIDKAQESDNSTEILDGTLEKLETVESEEDATIYIDRKEEIDEMIRNLNDNQLEFLEQEFESRLDEFKQEYFSLMSMEDGDLSDEDKKLVEQLEKKIKDIEREQTDIIARAISKRKDTIKNEMRKKYEKMIEDKIREYENSDNTDIRMVQLERLKDTRKELFVDKKS